MTAPIPEERDEPPLETGTPPGEHAAELADPDDGVAEAGGVEVQEENAETSLDEPSDGSGGGR